MKIKLKAEELVQKYQNIDILQDWEGIYETLAIECAKIAVDEIVEYIDRHEFEVDYEELKYWQEVKNELNKMV